jgi:hypothetical protein
VTGITIRVNNASRWPDQLAEGIHASLFVS